ncbi:MAG: BatD family protein [Gammaproteobacteria bacterium]
MVNWLTRVDWLTRLLTLFLACGCLAARAQVELEVRPDPAVLNQSIELRFRVPAVVEEAPDFSPLAALFDIVKTSSQSSQFALNGRVERSTTYVLEVMPKRSGKVVIPALSFGGARSPARQLEIREEPLAGDAGGAPDFIVEALVSTATPYVQQQVIYTVRALFAVQVSSPRLTPVSASGDAVVKQLGDGRQVSETRDGRSYEGFEMKYAVFPQASGTLRLAPAVVTAEVVVGGRRSVFDPFAQSLSTRRIESKPVELEVRPVPAAFPAGATWLPARRLRLHEEWEPDQSSAEVGAPITRTVFLWVDGLLSGQLPKLALRAPADVKLYPDQAQTSDQDTATGYTAVLQQKFAVIAAQPGKPRFDTLEVPWWNTETDALEVARLPARELEVIAAPGAAPSASPPPIPAPAERAATDIPDRAPAAPASAAAADSPWRAVAAVLALVWLATLVLWWRSRGAPTTVSSARSGDAVLTPAPRGSEDLAGACRANDARAAYAALLRLARARGLGTAPRALAAGPDTPLALAIAELERQRYGADPARWSGAPLLAAWQAEGERSMPRGQAGARAEALPPLHRLGAG